MLGMIATVRGGVEEGAVPASCRPRGRPYEAYALSYGIRCRYRVWVGLLVAIEGRCWLVAVNVGLMSWGLSVTLFSTVQWRPIHTDLLTARMP